MPIPYMILLITSSVLLILFMLYLLATRPAMRRPGTSDFMQAVYAHRGLHDEKRPENSLSAFEAACRAGYAIELDVQLSSDGVPMVFHDASLDRVCGRKGLVKEYTAADLSQMPLCGQVNSTIPTLSAVLAKVAGRVPLMVEIKATDKADAIAVCKATAALLDHYTGPYCIESFNPYAVHWFKVNRPAIIRGQLSSHFWKDPQHRTAVGLLMQSLATNFLTQPDFISFDRQYSRLFSFKLATRFWGAYAVAWTVKSRAQEHACRGHFDCIIFEGYTPVWRERKR